MTTAPLQVPVVVSLDDRPLVDAMRRVGLDVGSVSARRVRELMEQPDMLPPMDPAIRLLCFATADHEAMVQAIDKLSAECLRINFRRMGRLLLMGGPLDTKLAVFVDVPTIGLTI